jgi:hypothetical protein
MLEKKSNGIMNLDGIDLDILFLGIGSPRKKDYFALRKKSPNLERKLD